MNLPILYLQVSVHFEWKFPFIFFRFKCGITNRGLRSRSRNIAETTPGWQRPIFFCIVPEPRYWEKKFHGMFSHCHAPMREGSGKTEWYAFGFCGVYLFEILMYYLAIWVVEFLILYKLIKFLI